jgi:hypothetical protein
VGQACEAGQCVPCEPQCLGLTCGDDGCGGSCGECDEGLTCHPNGVCVDACLGITYEGCCEAETLRYCDGGELKEIPCDAADGACGWSSSGFYDCGTDGAAEPTGAFAKDCAEVCVPSCAGKACGDDGCGQSCGGCDAGWDCLDGQCVHGDTPDCAGKECGPDGMGGSCGECAADETCTALGQCEAPVVADVVDDAPVDTVADVAPDKTADDVPAPDAPASDTEAPDDDGPARDQGGGGGCAVAFAQPAFGSLFVTLLALLALLALARRRSARLL